MNVIGEYILQFDIFTMFDVFTVKIRNHNLITKNGYEFFLKKWYQDEIYPIILGYYHENRFYEQKNIDDTYNYELIEETSDSYNTKINYIDRDSHKQYRFDGENFVDFNEKLDKICIGDYTYLNESLSKPSDSDVELYAPIKEYKIDVDEFELNNKELLMKCDMKNDDLNGTTEIGVKTNHGRLISHDIHPPYNLPFETNITLEYSFKLTNGE